MKIPMLILNLALLLLTSPSLAKESNQLSSLLEEAFAQNFEIKAYAEDSRAERKLITSQYSFSNPSIGISRLDRGNTTEYLTLQQSIKFPTKYFLAGKSQEKMYESSKSNLDATKLGVRKSLIEVYYALYSVQKTIQLTRTNLQLVKDFARIAEKKYASRNSSQSDSMKAHFEMTQLELNLLNFEQEESLLHSRMNTLLGRHQSQKINLASLDLDNPKVYIEKIKNDDGAISQQISKTSPLLIAQEKKLEASNIKKSLAKWDFAPDFNLQYQKRISGFPEDSSIFSINATIPLWFWKDSANASAASAKASAEEYRHKNLQLKFVEDLKSLKVRIMKANKMLLIYKTTLMPQAESSYRSSRSAYKAGSASFLDLLDAERSLYSVKQSYYKALTFFVRDVVEAETILGTSISNLSGLRKAQK
jgi:outer membrane protein TolC